MILVSSTEPKCFHSIGELSKIPEEYGSDFLLCSEKSAPIAGIQRKQFPSDFISSVQGSDRMARLLPAISELEYKLMIIEGKREVSSSGKIVHKYSASITEKSLNSMIHSIHHSFGVQVLWTENQTETYNQILYFFEWVQNSIKSQGDSSLLSRCQSKEKSLTAKRIHFLQGLPGIGYGTAKKILSHCGGVPLMLTRNLTEIDGIGKKKVDEILKVLGY